MGLTMEYDPGQTPLDLNEIDGLIISSIATRGELDEFEQENLEDALQWVLSKDFSKAKVLSQPFIKQLHKRMLGQVWNWAGDYRQTDKNLGVSHFLISTSLQQLLDNCAFWIEHSTYPPHEIAIRFKHRLVSIHCFSNGNGRHSRLMADILIDNILGETLFTWGAKSALKSLDARAQYLKSLKQADLESFDSLIQFARS
jgi:Fic-DOC domain mobile mystery protein B